MCRVERHFRFGCGQSTYRHLKTQETHLIEFLLTIRVEVWHRNRWKHVQLSIPWENIETFFKNQSKCLPDEKKLFQYLQNKEYFINFGLEFDQTRWELSKFASKPCSGETDVVFWWISEFKKNQQMCKHFSGLFHCCVPQCGKCAGGQIINWSFCFHFNLELHILTLEHL